MSSTFTKKLKAILFITIYSLTLSLAKIIQHQIIKLVNNELGRKDVVMA
jgi:hypothetical protein